MKAKKGQSGFIINPFVFSEKDPYFANVKVLLPLSSAVGLTDVKGNSWNSFGGFSISTDYWAEGSGSFSGLPKGIQTAHNPSLSLAEKDFTIEFDYYVTGDAHTGHAIIGQWGSAQGTFGWLLTNSWGSAPPHQIAVAMSPNGYYQGGGAMRHFFGSGDYSEVTLNAWHRVAVTRAQNVFYIHLDGRSLIVTPMGYGNTSDANFTIFDPGLPLQIFPFSGDGNSAHIKNLRVTLGFGRYTGDYSFTNKPFPNS